MRRFGRVLWAGTARWVEFNGEGEACLLSAQPADIGCQIERIVSEPEMRPLPFLPPAEATKVIGLAYNYKSLVGIKDQYEEPLFFLKSPTSICPHNSCVPYPEFAAYVWVEVELAVIIGRDCHRVTEDEAEACILGYSIGSDITAENVHGRDWHLARSKALDRFSPIGPFLVTGLCTDNLEVRSYINGKEFQRGNTSDRILNDRQAVSLLSRYVTLKPGDVILTGTPAGARASVVKKGDIVTHCIDQLGELIFRIV